MGTYERPSLIIDPTAQALREAGAGITKTGAEIAAAKKKEEELEKIRRNKLNEDLYGLDLAVSSMPDAEDRSFDNSVDNMLKGELERIHRLGQEALKSGDNSLYLKEKAAFESMVKEMPVVINSINKEGEIWSNSSAEGVGSFLNGSNEPWKINLMENWNKEDGKDIIPKYVNGKLVLEYEGNVVNTATLIKNLKSGGNGLITYMDDPQPALKEIFKTTAGPGYVGYKYVDTQRSEFTGKMREVSIADYSAQNERVREQLMSPKEGDDPLATRFNQNNWEFFRNSGQFTNTPEQRLQLREQMVDFMMNSYGHADQVKVGETKIQKDKPPKSPYSIDEVKDIKSIQNIDTPERAVELLNSRKEVQKAFEYYTVDDTFDLYKSTGEYINELGKVYYNKIKGKKLTEEEKKKLSKEAEEEIKEKFITNNNINTNQIFKLDKSRKADLEKGDIYKAVLNTPIRFEDESIPNTIFEELDIDYATPENQKTQGGAAQFNT